MKIKTGILAAIAGGAVWLALDRLRGTPPMDLKGKVVLITGGSRGLGLAMAREFGLEGAIVAICARDEEELDRAVADLEARGMKAYRFVCDLTKPEQILATVNAVNDRIGPVDVLVNNAGIIKVGPFASMQIDDFEEAMKVMFWGALHATLAVLPSMRSRGHGSIVNITSIGGKVSVPHLLPYSCAKFAAVALSQGLRTELAAAGIGVTTVVPGLMRTGSHLNAKFSGKQADEYAWFAAAAASPLVSISAERAARSVVNATIKGESETILSVPAEILALLQGGLPNLTSGVLEVANRFLPAAGSAGTRKGSEMESQFHSTLWKIFTRLGEMAALSLNER